MKSRARIDDWVKDREDVALLAKRSPLLTVENPALGIEAQVVALKAGGLAVRLRDVDSGITLDFMRVFAEAQIDAAMACAKDWAGLTADVARGGKH
jgi:hypothetical protein